MNKLSGAELDAERDKMMKERHKRVDEMVSSLMEYTMLEGRSRGMDHVEVSLAVMELAAITSYGSATMMQGDTNMHLGRLIHHLVSTINALIVSEGGKAK